MGRKKNEDTEETVVDNKEFMLKTAEDAVRKKFGIGASLFLSIGFKARNSS